VHDYCEVCGEEIHGELVIRANPFKEGKERLVCDRACHLRLNKLQGRVKRLSRVNRWV
jgi:ribosome-binding protein aMBF1 (putative translation factor)